MPRFLRMFSTVVLLALACASADTHATARVQESQSAHRGFGTIQELTPGQNPLVSTERTEEKLFLPGARASDAVVARYYNPAIARFTTEDPEAGKALTPPSLHRYLYAYANPTVYVDPTGRQSANPYDAIEYMNPTPEERERFYRTVDQGQAGAYKAIGGFVADSAVGAALLVREAVAQNIEVTTLGLIDLGARERSRTAFTKAASFLANDPLGQTKQAIDGRFKAIDKLSAAGDMAGAAEAQARLGLDTASVATGVYGVARGTASLMARSYAKLLNRSTALTVTEGTSGEVAFRLDDPAAVQSMAASEAAALDRIGANQRADQTASLDTRINSNTYTGDKYRDAGGRLRYEDGRYAPDGAARAAAAVDRSQLGPYHGNTAGDQTAYLYGRYDAEGNFLKWGVTQDLSTRYSTRELAGGELVPFESGPRSQILKKERELAETQPGPLNNERWAGQRKKEQ